MNKQNMEARDPDPDIVIDQLIREYDDTSMPLPDLECEPHLLISKVRKHYMEYVTKLLCSNYETNQKLVNKNIYLPSAIWRCAKNIETSAAQACMVVQLYRRNIQNVIQELKNDTMKGKLNKKLFDCLHRPPTNLKKTQTNLSKLNDSNCQCTCNDKKEENGMKKRRRTSNSPTTFMNKTQINKSFTNNDLNLSGVQLQTPANLISFYSHPLFPMTPVNGTTPKVPYQAHSNNVVPLKNAMPVETFCDDLTEKLEKLFHSDPNDDDLFEGSLCQSDYNFKEASSASQVVTQIENTNNTIMNDHAAKIQSLNERVASLAGILANAADNSVSQQRVDSQINMQDTDGQKTRKDNRSKWLCQEYFLKVRLYELLDQIRESNRIGHLRIKELFLDLFGDDSDDEGVVSPLEETPEFVISCKDRIAPWVVDLLTPYYVKGRIKGKILFKSLAKHLIRLIYQCSKYPDEHEVTSFVSDFLQNHKMIRCEADYKQFRIDNLVKE